MSFSMKVEDILDRLFYRDVIMIVVLWMVDYDVTVLFHYGNRTFLLC